ncbi:MAG: DEAD/DEAH box helicase family protein [Lewinellaceae bacterium]|nr:DEAD/DEAH box helicase family protein [Phaeodactylibacter sp.]MCB9037539.1 DEAD/DEAH box helicase family protein [Lewinellaceae bacterium]
MKRQLSEIDICMKYITPALQQAGWDIHAQVFREASLNQLTKGRIHVRGQLYKRGAAKRADYILVVNNIPIAVIEAKKNTLAVSAGMQQALEYAEMLDLLFAYSSNGDGFHEHDKTLSQGDIEREIPLGGFPSPQELWERYKRHKGIEDDAVEKVVTHEFYEYQDGKQPRYYQIVAINRTVEAVAKGQDRILLVMATGTGKTLTAFQVIWKLWKSGLKKRILFLADRNILLDQARTGDFRYFGDKMTIVRQHKVEKQFEVYLALYQGLTGQSEVDNIYREFSRDFFDLVVIDECHRGSASSESNWRSILEYFDGATHIGLTATPKETSKVSNIFYFGEPVYTYSLKQGIQDGFLAPYKVIRIDIDRDVLGWRPEGGQLDIEGNIVPDRIYNSKDFDRTLVIDSRTRLVAKRVSDFLKKTGRFSKTIIFCVDIDHAERMRIALANENKDLCAENPKYVMRITGDNPEGKLQLDNFIDPASQYPVIATTSKLLTTGVDAQTCKLIVLDAPIESMTEFKQIIGRGTRINEEFGKSYFTIMDCRNVTKLFADPAFDGEPIMVYEPELEDEIPPSEEQEEELAYPTEDEVVWDPPTVEEEEGHYRKTRVDGIEVSILRERVQYMNAEGKLITESLKDYTRKGLRQEFRSLDEFLLTWNAKKRKKELIEELEEQGLLLHELQSVVDQELDLFDLICHVAFDQPPLTRRERANKVKKRNYFTKYGTQARKVLEGILDKYADQGVEEIETMKVLQLDPFRQMGTPRQITDLFGGKNGYLAALQELEEELYGFRAS